MRAPMLQPTTLRENKSITTAIYSQKRIFISFLLHRRPSLFLVFRAPSHYGCYLLTGLVNSSRTHSYEDASDQCSLSRIWGGIHPPADDIPGRIMGAKIGQNAFQKALVYF